MSDIGPSHPKWAADHEENRKKVCCCCGIKVKILKTGNYTIVNDSQVLNIKEYINNDYNDQDDHYPIGLCVTCRLYLVKKRLGHQAIMPIMPNYKDVSLAKTTRLRVRCNCYICITGRSKRYKNIQRDISTVINRDNGLHAVLTPSLVNTPPNDTGDNKRRSITICSICKQEVGKGLNHPKNCSTASASTNLSQQALDLPTKQKDQVVSILLNDKATNELGKGGFHKDVTMKLSTKGRHATVTLNPKPKKPVFFSNEDIADLQAFMGHSNKGMKKICHWLRVHQGRKSIPPHIRSDITTRGKTMKDFYKVIWMDLDVGKDKVESRPVFYGDATTIVNKVCEARDILGPCFIKLMVDSGQGTLKFSLTIVPHDYDPETGETEVDHSDCNSPQQKKLRTSYAEGGSVGKGKLSGVKRLITLINVVDVQESWGNLKKLWDLAAIEKISYLLSSDFKLTLSALGLQTATSMYPCPYCLVSLRQLRGLEDIPEDEEILEELNDQELLSTEDVLKTTFEERTFGHIRKDVARFREMGSSRSKHGKLCNSTVNDSLLQEDDDIRVIDKVPFPELHVHEGVLNHVFFEKGGLVDVLGKEKAMQWPKKLGVVSVGYHGEKFEGPACRKLLKKADYLLSEEFLKDVTNQVALIPIVQVLRAFDKVVEATFGCKYLKGDVSQLVVNFTDAFMALGLSIPLKVHCVMEHLIPGLANLGGRGMGLTSEQTGESFHHHFKTNFWERYKISSLDNPNFEEAWFAANLECVSKQI